MADGATDGATPDGDKGKDEVDDFEDGAADDEKELGDAGKRALAAERSARTRAERDAKAAKAELAKLKAGTQTDNEKALAKAREEGVQEAAKAANARLLKSEIRAAAAGKLEDPNDAVRLLDADDFTDADGEVDEAKLKKAVADLLKAKPYLASTGARRTKGGGDGGARGTGGGTPGMNDLIRRGAGYR